MIEVKNLVKRYGNHLALDNVSFTIEKGEVVGFLGPNGAGKSTTMNIITGYLSSTEGEVLVDGLSVLDNPEKAKQKIGYLPEIPPLYTDMTVNEYLSFVCDLKKVPMSQKAEMITRITKQVRINDVRKRLIRNLSKGYKQRVGIAQALIGQPELLILDEPTVGLDPKQITEVRDLIKNLSEDHTLIISSHILAEVQALVSRTNFNVPRRMADGFDINRAVLLMAVLEKRGGINLAGSDVYINVIGGLQLTEPAADLPVILAAASSFRDKALDSGVAAIGEVGLTGELRAVSNLNQRLSEVHRLGFRCCVIPRQGTSQVQPPEGLEILRVRHIREAIETLL